MTLLFRMQARYILSWGDEMRVLKALFGNGHPVQVYKGAEKLAGWRIETKSGESVSFLDTYNDSAEVELTGNTVQASDYYAKDGLSSQVQTVQGKNLIDKSRLQVREVGGDSIPGSYTVTDGVITYTALNGSFGIIITTVQVSQNTNYSASLVATVLSGSISSNNGVRIHFVNTNTYTSVVPNSRSTSFNSGENTLIDIMFYVGFPTTLDGVVELKNFQLELGSSATSYTPFVPNSPSPDYPSPITSNLPAGTYKTTCDDGIYEFTLAEELRGIGSNVDKVVFDRKSHRGILERKIGKTVFNGTENWYKNTTNPVNGGSFFVRGFTNILGARPIITNYYEFVDWTYATTEPINACAVDSVLSAIYCKHMFITEVIDYKAWLVSRNSSGNPLTVYYQLKNPTRAPLSFTKVSSSSAPECPMTFLTNTPSLDYPADVVDASGNVLSNGVVVGAFPPLRKVGEVADSFASKTGKKTKRIEKIPSYAGETIATPYLSTTGALTTGATVLYQLATPVEEQYTPTPVPTHLGQTIISTDSAVKPTITATAKVPD